MPIQRYEGYYGDQVFEYVSEKMAFEDLYNFEMRDSLPPCSEFYEKFETDKLAMFTVPSAFVGKK